MYRGLQNFFQQFQCATIYNHKLCEKTPKKTLQYQDAFDTSNQTFKSSNRPSSCCTKFGNSKPMRVVELGDFVSRYRKGMMVKRRAKKAYKKWKGKRVGYETAWDCFNLSGKNENRWSSPPNWLMEMHPPNIKSPFVRDGLSSQTHLSHPPQKNHPPKKSSPPPPPFAPQKNGCPTCMWPQPLRRGMPTAPPAPHVGCSPFATDGARPRFQQAPERRKWLQNLDLKMLRGWVRMGQKLPQNRSGLIAYGSISLTCLEFGCF